MKVVQKNEYCYQGFNKTYNEYLYNGSGNIVNTCAPLERDFSSVGIWCVVGTFIIFFVLVVAASIATQLFTQFKSAACENRISEAYLQCFSIQNLWNQFVRRRASDKSQFNFLDGIRVGSMSWVIFGHAFNNNLGNLRTYGSNFATLLPVYASAPPYDRAGTKWYMMTTEYGPFSVDSFFWLSGMLNTFSIVRHMDKYGNSVKLIPMFYIIRILRLVPMMMFVTAFQWQISDQLPYGYHVTDRVANKQACAQHWFKILFFYDNLELTSSTVCMGHLWYVQCDMQFFLILPFLVLVFQWKTIWGLCATLVVVLLSMLCRLFLAIVFEPSANITLPGNIDAYVGYIFPWSRAAVYFIGAFTMLIVITLQKDKRFHISENTYFAFMFMAGFILLSLVFWPYSDAKEAPQKRWSVLSNQFYFVLGRPAWYVSIHFILICQNN